MTATQATARPTAAFRPDAWSVLTLAAGLGLAAAFWWVSWDGPEPVTHVAFFPLWLGYILVVDGLVQLAARRRSLLRRAPLHWAALFLLSAPVWWAFELLNLQLDNWNYLGSELFSPVSYAIWATIAFSTVIPAVFETTELVAAAGRVRFPSSDPAGPSPSAGTVAIAAGLAGIALLVFVPRYAFPLAWIAPWLIFDGLNARAAQPTILGDLLARRWHRPAALAFGGLLCGFFWEMWNIEAYPKWVYDVPFFGFLKVFEMPLLGYGGYVPFAWSLYAFYRWVTAALRRTPLL